MPLEGYNKDDPDPLYVDETGRVWRAVGWINDPAVILRAVDNEEKHVEVIGCWNARRFKRLRPES